MYTLKIERQVFVQHESGAVTQVGEFYGNLTTEVEVETLPEEMSDFVTVFEEEVFVTLIREDEKNEGHYLVTTNPILSSESDALKEIETLTEAGWEFEKIET